MRFMLIAAVATAAFTASLSPLFAQMGPGASGSGAGSPAITGSNGVNNTSGGLNQSAPGNAPGASTKGTSAGAGSATGGQSGGSGNSGSGGGGGGG